MLISRAEQNRLKRLAALKKANGEITDAEPNKAYKPGANPASNVLDIQSKIDNLQAELTTDWVPVVQLLLDAGMLCFWIDNNHGSIEADSLIDLSGSCSNIMIGKNDLLGDALLPGCQRFFFALG